MLDSSLEYKKLIRENSSCELSGRIVFADGTEMQLTGDDFISGSGSFDSCTSTSGSFDIGNASIGTFDCALNNADGRFSTFDFNGATIFPVVRKRLSNGYELIPKGIYKMEDANSLQSVVSITAYDNMSKFEKPYSEVSTAYPATLYKIVNDICAHCGVVLSTTRFDNYEYTIDKRPEDDMSCIDVISYVAQISGNYARIDTNGRLVFDWYDKDAFSGEDVYDGGTFSTSTTPYSDGDTLDGGNFANYGTGTQADGGSFTDSDVYRIQAFTNPFIATDEIEITGINIKVSDGDGNEQNVLVGTDTYALSISGNPFINTGNVNDIAQIIADKTIGLKFRPFSVSAMSDPTLEAGDPVLVVTQNGAYRSYVTRTTYKLGGYQSIACEAETPSKNRATTRGATTTLLQQTKAIVNKKVSAYDLQMQALTNLMSNSFGVFKSEEKLADGSTIYYLHNKPDRSQSSTIWKMTANTLTVSTDGGRTWNAGIDASGNAVVNVLSAVGINADWINAGEIDADKINIKNLVVGDNVTMGNNATIGWGNVTNPPTIPTKTSQLTNDSDYKTGIQVTQITKNTITSPYIATLNLEVGDEISMGANAKITWANVTNQPTIPSKTSQLTNDSGYQNSTQVNNLVTAKGYQTATDVNTIINSKGFKDETGVRTIVTGYDYKTGAQIKNTIEGYGYQTQANVQDIVTGYNYQTGAQVKSRIEGYGYQTAIDVNGIITNTVTASFVNALAVKAGSVDAENITGQTISGKKISGCEIDSSYKNPYTNLTKQIEIKEGQILTHENNVLKSEIDKDGITMRDADGKISAEYRKDEIYFDERSYFDINAGKSENATQRTLMSFDKDKIDCFKPINAKSDIYVTNGFRQSGYALLDKSGHRVYTEWTGTQLNFYVDQTLVGTL